jgi:hypothetical protein
MSKKSEQRKTAHTGKRKYPTKAAADAAILDYERNGTHRLHSYPCPFGKHWHVGHKSKKKSKTPDAKPEGASDPEINSTPVSSDAVDSPQKK